MISLPFCHSRAALLRYKPKFELEYELRVCLVRCLGHVISLHMRLRTAILNSLPPPPEEFLRQSTNLGRLPLTSSPPPPPPGARLLYVVRSRR